MSAEIWQFAGLVATGITVMTLWVLFVYRPRRTGEGTHPVDPTEKEEIPERDQGQKGLKPRWGLGAPP
jgi:hypothetical protein